MAIRPVDVTIRGKDDTQKASDAAVRRMALVEIEAHKMNDAMEAGAAKAKKSFFDLSKPLDLLKGVIAGVVIAGVGNFFRESVSAAAEADATWGRAASALENVGIAAAAVRPEVTALGDQIQASTRFDDDAAIDSFATLLSISGDYAGSLKNVRLASDLAAAKQIDLKTASDLVGKAMVGQTGTLSRYGIIVAQGADAVQVMRDRFNGFAERDAATLEGRLKQLGNAWDDVKKGVGHAVAGMDDTPTSAGGVVKALTDKLASLATWIDDNRSNFHELEGGVITFTSAVGTLANALGAPIFRAFWHLFRDGYYDAQAVIVAFVAIMEMIPQQARYAAGGILRAFGELAAQWEPLLEKLGIKLDGLGDRFANLGTRMQREALRQGGIIGNASRDTISDILGERDGKRSNSDAALTDAERLAKKKAEQDAKAKAATEAAAAARKKYLEDLQKELELLTKGAELGTLRVQDTRRLLELQQQMATLAKSSDLRERNIGAAGVAAIDKVSPLAGIPGLSVTGPGKAKPSPMANITGADLAAPGAPPESQAQLPSLGDEFIEGFHRADDAIAATRASMAGLSSDIGGTARDAIDAFAGTWGDAAQQIGEGSISVGQAILKSTRMAIAGAVSAKGSETLLDAAKAFAEGFKNPVMFGVAAKLFAVGSGYKMLAGALGGGGGGAGSAGGGGGGGGLSPAGFSAGSAPIEQGHLTVIMKGKKMVLDADDADDQDGFLAMLKKVAGNRQIDFVVEG